MKLSTKNNIKGKLRESKGAIKETTGKILNNPQLESEGKVEKLSGMAQQKIGEAEKLLGE